MQLGRSVVIDNTNPDPESRAPYIQLAKEQGFTARCYKMVWDKPLCMHNNTQRAFNSAREHFSKKVSNVVIHTFFKNAVQPRPEEGFDEVRQVRFIATFVSDKDRDNFMAGR
jgi:bifunctional polynucleotide phosphatase/kinase